jgi:hypothetical protein
MSLERDVAAAFREANAARIMREALEKLRLHGSPFWREEWGTPSHLANEALNATDAYNEKQA